MEVEKEHKAVAAATKAKEGNAEAPAAASLVQKRGAAAVIKVSSDDEAAE